MCPACRHYRPERIPVQAFDRTDGTELSHFARKIRKGDPRLGGPEGENQTRRLKLSDRSRPSRLGSGRECALVGATRRHWVIAKPMVAHFVMSPLRPLPPLALDFVHSAQMDAEGIAPMVYRRPYRYGFPRVIGVNTA